MLDKPPLQLNNEFQYALDLLEKTDKCLFLTGKAGTGKSTLLNLFKSTTRKKTVFLAPTGIAALHIGGQTIHSFFGFPPRILTEKEAKSKPLDKQKQKLFKALQVLVIDEISMVRADVFDAMDYFLRHNRGNNLPFGGVQLAIIGDLFQLPPVIGRDPMEKAYFDQYYETPYFFSAKVMTSGELDLEMIELGKVYRQESRQFLRLLDAIRVNEIDYDDLEDINERHIIGFSPPPDQEYITLTARNATADKINATELLKLKGPDFDFLAKVEGIFDPTLYPVESALRLRIGAQVMFVKNDPDRAFVNGTIGRVVEITPETIQVETVDNQGKKRKIDVPLMEWEIIRYQMNAKDELVAEVLGVFRQYPLRYAWAITIHKSQGKTFDRIIVDLGTGAFENGQLYVALSRCRTLDGIVLQKPLQFRDIMTDERIISFYQQAFR